MRIKKAYTLLTMIFLLLLCGCSGTGGEKPSSEKQPVDGVVLAASFQQEDGSALDSGNVCFSFGESSTEHLLNDGGELKVSGLPRTGELMLTLYDGQKQVQSEMLLSISEGAVIDATTDDSGIGHISLRADTDEVSLVFVLNSDGFLSCALWLL